MERKTKPWGRNALVAPAACTMSRSRRVCVVLRHSPSPGKARLASQCSPPSPAHTPAASVSWARPAGRLDMESHHLCLGGRLLSLRTSPGPFRRSRCQHLLPCVAEEHPPCGGAHWGVHQPRRPAGCEPWAAVTNASMSAMYKCLLQAPTPSSFGRIPQSEQPGCVKILYLTFRGAI